jgi:hypothetical protein
VRAKACAKLSDAGFDVGFDVGSDVGFNAGFNAGFKKGSAADVIRVSARLFDDNVDWAWANGVHSHAATTAAEKLIRIGMLLITQKKKIQCVKQE